jgi:hypothetical protein
MRCPNLFVTDIASVVLLVGGWAIKSSEKATSAEWSTKDTVLLTSQGAIVIVPWIPVFNTLLSNFIQKSHQILAGGWRCSSLLFASGLSDRLMRVFTSDMSHFLLPC